MSSTFTPKKFVVPGSPLGGAAEQLAQQSEVMKQKAEPLTAQALGAEEQIAAKGTTAVNKVVDKMPAPLSDTFSERGSTIEDAAAREGLRDFVNTADKEQKEADRPLPHERTGELGDIGNFANAQARQTNANKLLEAALYEEDAVTNRRAALKALQAKGLDGAFVNPVGPVDPRTMPPVTKSAAGVTDKRLEAELMFEERVNNLRARKLGREAAEKTDRAAEASVVPDLQPMQKQWKNVISNITQSAMMTGLATAEGFAILTQMNKDVIDIDKFTVMRKDLEELVPTDPARAEEFFTKLSQGAGSYLTFMAAGFLMGGKAAIAVGGLSQGAAGYRDAESKGATDEQKKYAFTLNTLIGMTEGVPISRFLMRQELMSNGGVTAIINRAWAEGREEAVQELFQGVASDVVAKFDLVPGMAYDPAREMDPLNYLEQGAIGGLLGAGGGAVSQAAIGKRESAQSAEAELRVRAQETLELLSEAQDKFNADFEVSPEDAAVNAPDPNTAVELPADPGGTDAQVAQPLVTEAEATEASAQLAAMGVTLDPEAVTNVTPEVIESTLTELSLLDKAFTDALTVEEQTQITEALSTALTAAAAEVTNAAPAIDMPLNESGKLEVVHYANQALDVIDPTKMGTGPLRGEERNRLQGDSAVPRSYFGVSPIVDFKPSKAKPYTTRSDGYRKEGGLGDVRHVVEVDPSTVYPWWEDPQGIRAKLDRTKPDLEQVSDYEKLIADAGFVGVYYSQSNLGKTAMLFQAAEPTSVVDDATGQVLRGPVNVNGASNKALKTLTNPEYQPLPGLPVAQVGPVKKVVDAAKAYMASVGQAVRRQKTYVKVDVDRATRIAQAYEDMPNTPNDPATLASYRALAAETLAQYQIVKASGLDVEFIEEGQADPYPAGPKQVLDDLKRGHLWVFPTEGGFGTVNEADTAHPLLEKTDEFVGDRQLVVNDVFRIVHDFFGHGIEGAGFGARGEENAWQSHARMFSEAALPAMTSETRGQNSWVNYGPHGEANRSNQKDTVYADQKIGLMPEWTWREGFDAGPAQLLATPEDFAKLADTNDPSAADVLQMPGWAIVTATQERAGGPRSPANVANNNRLAKQLAGTNAIEVSGMYEGIDQGRSWIVFTDEAGALSIADKYKQDSVLTNKGFVFRDGAVQPANHGMTTWGEAAKATGNYTTLPDGSVFSVGIDWNVEPEIDAQIAPDVQEMDRVSNRVPVTKGVVEDHMADTRLVIDAEAMKVGKEKKNSAFSKNIANIKAYVSWPKQHNRLGPDKVADIFVDEMADNLVWLYNQVPKEVRERTRKWYEGANRLTQEWGERYELPPRAIAGVLARLSPGKDWYINVTLAERMLDIMAYHSDNDVTPAMTEKMGELFAPGTNLHKLSQMLEGRSLRALADQGEPLALQALWVRVYDQTYNDRSTNTVTAEGDFIDDGGSTVAWQSIDNIALAMGMIQDPSVANLSNSLGTGHKIRNFYNNIIAPHSLTGDVTIDTHAVAADMVMPLSQTSTPVAQNFGQSPDKAKQKADFRPPSSVGVTGARGTYGLHADAYRKAAAQLGLLPRELQSITWEAGRQLFRPAIKSNPDFVQLVNDLWSEYASGKKSKAKVRDDIVAAANKWAYELAISKGEEATLNEGIPNPDWYTEAADGAGVEAQPRASNDGGERTSSYKRDVSGTELPVWSARGDIGGRGSGISGALQDSVGAQDDIDAQTSMNRAPFALERSRPGQGVPGLVEGDASIDTVSLRNIVKNFLTILDLTARQGRVTIRNASGQYNRRDTVIRVKSFDDLSTIVHEGGHALHDTASAGLSTWVDANAVEIERAGTELYAGDLTNASREKHRREGFAEFFRIYVLSRAQAEAKYPSLVQGLDAYLLQTAPQTKDGIDSIRDQYDLYQRLPSANVAKNKVVQYASPSGMKASVREMKEAGFNNWWRETVRRTVRAAVNKWSPYGDTVADLLDTHYQNTGNIIDLKAADNPYILARLMQNAGARATAETNDGVIPHRGTEPMSRGLREATLLSQGFESDGQISEVDANRQNDFAAYVVALTALSDHANIDAGIGHMKRPPTDDTIGDHRQTVATFDAKYGPKFREAAEIVDEYGRALWLKEYEGGRITKQTYVEGLDRAFYAPLQRDMSDMKTKLGTSVLAGGRGVNYGPKQRKGSGRPIIDPVQVLIQKTFSLEQFLAQNDTNRALGKLAEQAVGAGEVAEKIPAHDMVPVRMNVLEMAQKITEDPNMSMAQAADFMSIMQSTMTPEKFVTTFYPEQAATKGENIVFYWDEGKLNAVRLSNSAVGSELAALAEGLGTEIMPLGVEMFALTSTMFRQGITSWLDFLLINYMRDQVSAWMLTDVGFVPFASGAVGIAEEIKQSGYARKYNIAMGSNGGMNVASLHDARVNLEINSMNRKGYKAKILRGKGLKGAAQAWVNIVEMSETATRIGIFRLAHQRAIKDGLSEYEAGVEAAFIATDYIDFGLHGSSTGIARRIVPFLSAQVNGLYKMQRTMVGDEAGKRVGKRTAIKYMLQSYIKDVNGMPLTRREKGQIKNGRKLYEKMIVISLASLALTLAYKDDPDFKNSNEYLRKTGWVIPLGGSKIFYIPKPFELATLANIVERSVEAIYGDETAMDKMWAMLFDTVNLPMSQPLVKAMVEHKANFSFFTERNIIPGYALGREARFQYDGHTSEFAKFMGEHAGWSPMVVDHYGNSLGASAYRDISAIMNQLMSKDRKDMASTDTPVLRRLLRDSKRGSTAANDFWAQASTADGSLWRAYDSYKRLKEEVKDREAADFLSGLDDDHKAYALLNTHFKSEEKNVHPMQRIRQISKIVGAIKRELNSDLGVANTEDEEFPLMLTGSQKLSADNLLSELITREMRNTLIMQNAPGWKGLARVDVLTTIEMIGLEHPELSYELHSRLRKAKVLSESFVAENWPDMKEQLLLDGEDAILGYGKLGASEAKVMGPYGQ